MKFILGLAFALIFVSAPLCRADDNSQAILNEINLARTNPHLYAQFILAQADTRSKADPRAMQEAVDFLNHARPLPPLAFSNGLAMGAMSHVGDQGAAGAVGHVGTDNSTFGQRMARYGKWIGRAAGENISYGVYGARQIVISLIVDAGVPDRGHRKNLFGRSFAMVGVACGSHARWGTMCVMDFADRYIDAGQRPSEARKPVALNTTNIAQTQAWSFGGL